MVPLSGPSGYQPFMIKVSGQTIGRRIHISPSEGENAKCSASNPQGLLNACSQSMPLSKTPSTSNAISSHAASTSSSGKPRLRFRGNALRWPDRRQDCYRLDPIELTCQCPFLPLPPRSPELNPVENIWQYIRDNWLSNRVFKCYDDIVAFCCEAWNNLIDRPRKIMSIGCRQ